MIDLGVVDVGAIPREELPELLGQVVALEARVRLRLAEPPASAAPSSADRLLDVAKVAERLGVSVRYVYRHGSSWACAMRVGRRLMFSEQGLARHIAQRRA